MQKQTRFFLLWLALLGCLFAMPIKAYAGWGEDALNRESSYIADASWTEQATNHNSVHATDDAYGCLNNVRIAQSGPDWVRPGEGSVAVIGLMAAAKQLHATHLPTDRTDNVLNAFFETWLLKRQQGFITNASDPDFGGMTERVYYSREGRYQRSDWATTGTTGIVICALWKRYEYLKAIGKGKEAASWLKRSWPLAKRSGDFIAKYYDPEYHMVRANSHFHELWLSDSVLSAAALKCLTQWSQLLHQSQIAITDAKLAANITTGIAQMKDSSSTQSNFFIKRSQALHYKPTYGDNISQLCFLPYEAGVLPGGDAFARRISDWWTRGDAQIQMTAQTQNAKDWRHFGTHWHYYFQPKPDNDKLYPGPGLQLAKVEWKYARQHHDANLLNRAKKRFEWANSVRLSNLWFGANGQMESGVGNGIVDWRSSTNASLSAQPWERFVDTSAYFLEVTLMICYNVDTSYVPSP